MRRTAEQLFEQKLLAFLLASGLLLIGKPWTSDARYDVYSLAVAGLASVLIGAQSWLARGKRPKDEPPPDQP